MIFRSIICAALCALLAACGQQTDENETAASKQTSLPADRADAPEEPVAVAKAAEIGAWGVDLSVRDESVDPGDDFNRYANGKWLDSFEIPADLSSYGIFLQLRLDAEGDVRAIVDELASKEPADGTLEQQVGDFYAAWMNTERLDELGAKPLQSHLERIGAIESREDLNRAFASLPRGQPYRRLRRAPGGQRVDG